MLRLKRFIALPLLALFISANAFSASGEDISLYASSIRDAIMKQSGNSLDKYKGKGCAVRIKIARDGRLLEAAAEAGYPELCNNLIDVIKRMKKLPSPPSEQIYQRVKEVVMDFKPR